MANTATAPLLALQSFTGRLGDADIVIRKGDSIDADHPAVKKWPKFFGPQATTHTRVEQATAAPGERRG